MLTIAVTGGIACGKSTVGSVIQARGIPVRDADEVAHTVMAEDTALRTALSEAFGPVIYREDGVIDRATLGQLVFQDRNARERLNALVHPRVREVLQAWCRDVEAGGAVACAGLIPLLFESGMERDWNVIVCVAATPAIQEARLIERGLTRLDARRRIAAQMPMAERIARSDVVIYNNGGLDLMKQNTERVLDHMLEAKHV